MRTAKPSPALPHHLNLNESHQWEIATTVHYIAACGGMCGGTHSDASMSDGQSTQLQTLLRPLDKLSEKDSRVLM